MGFTWVTPFECRVCGTRDEAATIDYDRLGYAVCPTCGASDGPCAARGPGVQSQPGD